MSKSQLCEAIENNDFGKVKLLIEEQADINESESLNSPILLACGLGNNSSAGLLLDCETLLEVIRKS